MAIAKFNTNFFKTIDNEEKAYWLGFLYADGYVYNSKQGLKTVIQLSIKDRSHLKKWHKSINSKNKLFTYKRKHKSGKTFEYVMSICISEKFANDLIKHGCKQRKSLLLHYPNIPNNLDNHFIRGFFDGDGGWVIRKRPTESSQISGKIVSNKEILDKINEIINLSVNIRPANKICPKAMQFTIEGNNKTRKFFNWLYKDATIYLDRKYKQALLHFKSVENKPYLQIDSKLYSAFGETKSISKWLSDKKCLVKKATLYARLNRYHWDFTKAITTPAETKFLRKVDNESN